MANGEQRGTIPIGTTLREARTRLGLDVKEAEEQTKIRARYIRALENEDWETLPDAVYIRGFLRSYGSILGLDGELLSDEFRRHHEVLAEPAPTPTAENVLSGRKRPSERPPSRAPMIAALLVGLALVLVLVAVLGGGGADDSANQRTQTDRQNGRGAGQGRQGGGGDGSGQREKSSNGGSSKKLSKEMTSVTAQTSGTVVCLVGGSKDALIDSQSLSGGDEQSFDGYKRYRLDVEGGIVRFKVGNDKQAIETSDPVSFEGDSNGITEVEYRGGDCP